MTPSGLSEFAKSVWVDTLLILDNEKLFPSDYVMLEQYCRMSDMIRQVQIELDNQPTYINSDGMHVPNQKLKYLSSLIATSTTIAERLGISRKMRKSTGDEKETAGKVLIEYIKSRTKKKEKPTDV